MTRIYLDVCCLNRPFDDQQQDRIRLESEAVLLILAHLEAGKWEWLGSEVVDWEIEQTPDPERKTRVRLLSSYVHSSITLGQAEVDRARQFESLGFRGFDALHLACAESGAADVFLTTDDKLLHLALRLADQLHIRVKNPLTWIGEVWEV